MLKEPPIWKFILCSAGSDTRPRTTTLKFEYLREFEAELENVLGYELGAHMGSIHEKNQGPKISCYCTFKVSMWKVSKVQNFLNIHYERHMFDEKNF